MKPKILIIPAWYPTAEAPVTGTFCQEQADLVFDSYNLRVIYPVEKPLSKINTGKRLFRLPATKFEPVLLGKTPGVKMSVYTSTFHSSSRNARLLYTQTRLWLQKWKAEGWQPAAIHAHGTKICGRLAADLSQSLGIPFMVTEHHSLLIADFDSITWASYSNVLEKAALVLSVSNELKKMILMNGVRAKIRVIGNVINEDFFIPRSGSRREGSLRILFVAVPAFTKDIPSFVSALGVLKRRGKLFTARLVIPDIAADLNREDVLSMCRKEDLVKECRVDGMISRDLMPGVIIESDVLVSTSITETFGLSIAEAIMCGLPVISTRSGGPEDFVNGTNGVLVDIGDVERIADALVEVEAGLSEGNRRPTRNEFVVRFGTEAFKKRLIFAYQSILND